MDKSNHNEGRNFYEQERKRIKEKKKDTQIIY